MSQDRAEACALAEEVLTDVELSRLRIDQLVFKASRLARLADDDEAEEWLQWERTYVPASESGVKWQFRTNRRYADDNHVTQGVARLAPIIATLHEELNLLRIPDLSGDYITIAASNIMNGISTARNQISKLETVVAAVNGEIHTFAAKHFYALRVSERQDSMFEEATTEIEQLLASLGADVSRKIDAAHRNLQAGDAEATASAMLGVRRLIDNFADATFPPRESERVDSSGKPIGLGSQNHLNRIKAFVDEYSSSKSRSDRMKRAITDIYGRVCAGLHADVSAGEARYLFLAAYAILGEMLSLRRESEDTLMNVTVDS
ncbi:hypothetical protein AB0H98_26140 [Nocardia salmonicida]|uniref:hypothetical protein n=1 Tax=Nocardia salmonicida TaxID=53431 RepID=UPI0033F06DCB